MNDDDILNELKRITKILLLSNAKAVEAEIGKIASSPDRKKMWILIDGKKGSKEIASEVGISLRGAQKFLMEARLAGLISYQGDFVQRVIDYVPPGWLELMIEKEVGPQETSQLTAQKENASLTLDSAINESKKGD